MKRKPISKSLKTKIFEESNYMCIYCGDPANEIEHIYPHSYSLNDKEENLVASCNICNRIAGDKVFEGFIDKQSYILDERRKKRYAKAIHEYRSICQGVGLPLCIVRSEEPKLKKEKKKILKRKEPILKRKSIRNKSPFPLSPVDVKPKPKKVPMLKKFIKIIKKPKPIGPAYDYSNIQAWQTLFKVKYQKENTYRNVAVQYGLKLETVRLIAEGNEPGNEVRKKLSLPMKKMKNRIVD